MNNKNKTHNFHFVLTEELKNKINVLSDELKYSKSQTAVYILKKTLCFLEKYHFELEETKINLSYQAVNWDYDMHIYMDELLYRKIKHLSDTIYAFSIAIVIRKLFELFFKYLEICDGKIERVERIFKRFYILFVKSFGNSKMKWRKEIKSEQLCGKFYYNLLFNEKFSIIGFNFNNSD